jgi:outer membrane protein assembly factor BamB
MRNLLLLLIGLILMGSHPAWSQVEQVENVLDANFLREAARQGDLESVERAIAAKVDINATTEYGVTALALASDHGHEKVVAALLAAGANPNTKDKFYRFSPLNWAVSRNHLAVVEHLVAAGADDVDGQLTSAVGAKNGSMLKVLLGSAKATIAGKQAALKSARQAKSDDLAKLIEESLPADSRSIPDEPKPSGDSSKLAEFAGEFANESGTKMTVLVDSDSIAIKPEDSERTMQITLVEGDKFAARGMDIVFTRTDGKVSSMQLKIGERVQTFSRVGSDTPAPSTKIDDSVKPLQLSQDYSFDSPHWPNFRGSLSRGIADGRELPTEWDAETNKNIAWKTPIPGLGTSSPVVWGNKVFITTAIQQGDESGFRVGPYGDVESVEQSGECQYLLLCLELDSGKVLWQKESYRGVPLVKRHAKSSHANPTPATDGNNVIAFFGNEGVYCYDLDGNLKWSRQVGKLDSGWFYDRGYQWGFGSSPFIFEDVVILQCDVQDGSFIAALDLATGEERWRTARDEIPTWSSPVAYRAPDGTPTVVVIGTKCSAAYEARTGERLWQMGGFSEIAVPTPQVTPDLVLLTTGYAPIQPIIALKHSARGELKMPGEENPGDPFIWAKQRGGPYMPTPLIASNRLYVLDNSGILSSFELETGKRLFRQRVRNDEATAYTASPVAGNGHLYLTAEVGITFVVAMDAEGTIVSENKIGEPVLSTPAIAANKILIRGEKHLFAIEKN